MSEQLQAKFIYGSFSTFETSVGTLPQGEKSWSVTGLQQGSEVAEYDEIEFTLRVVSGVSGWFNLYLYINNIMDGNAYRNYFIQEYRDVHGKNGYKYNGVNAAGPFIASIPQIDGAVIVNGSITKIPVRLQTGSIAQMASIKTNVGAISPDDPGSFAVQIQQSFSVLTNNDKDIGPINDITFVSDVPNGIAPETTLLLKKLVK